MVELIPGQQIRGPLQAIYQALPGVSLSTAPYQVLRETALMTSRCVVIGASAGGVEALNKVVSRLPADLSVPVFIVLHVPPFIPSLLAEILGRISPRPVVQAQDGARIQAGFIYVATPDHHLLIDKDRVAVTKGPKENRFRPSIDALFRSAAYIYGPGAIGVVLTGALDDGTSGLWSIKRLGGITVIQEPSEAQFDSMPRSALENVDIDHVTPSAEIGALLADLLQHSPDTHESEDLAIKERMATEVGIAGRDHAFQKGIMDLGEPTAFTCPECHGVLVRIEEGCISRYRCHTGHAYTDNALLEGVMESVGELIWQVIRGLEEGVMVLKNMADDFNRTGDTKRAGIFSAKAQELEKRSGAFHKDILAHESLSADNLGQVPEE